MEMYILSVFNQYHPDITFTVETESAGILNFLDVTLKRKDDGRLSRKVFRKKTHSNWYLDWTSLHHLGQKIAVIDSLTTRAISICDEDSLNTELNDIENILVANGYPRRIVTKRMQVIRPRPPKSIQPANSLMSTQNPERALFRTLE